MRGFRFNLETLLKHRRNIEEREKAKLGELNGQVLAATRRLEDLRALRDALVRELSATQSATFNAAELGWYYSYLDWLAREMGSAADRITELSRRLEDQKLILLEASKNKKVLDRLRERKWKQYLQLLEQDERKAAEDFVVMQFGPRT